MAKYDRYAEGVKTADNFIRTFNTQLSRAYKEGGENSRVYRNLVNTARQYFTDNTTGESTLRHNKAGAVQISRGIKNLESYHKKSLVSQLTNVMYKTDKYGRPKKNKQGGKILKSFYNSKDTYENAKKKLMRAGNTKPTKKQIQNQIQIDDNVSALFQMYGKYSTGAIDDTDYERWQDISRQVRENPNDMNLINKLRAQEQAIQDAQTSQETPMSFTTRFKNGIMLE